ncbi:MAG: murein biosynthesis integral membrane protein MurJ [Akkermansiaceae bacterium]|nr:murein biosynthesis integral membrane protein MurJ [Akkermansiaceae bacterium]MDP4721710.1 murein biosynthesis integral membrane protein MurJ [Akkermansiaceae bacterium]MDP4781579.1 murein biosynthesis integral membrane protein MurJ [Akkermansiaceae bacterium]
MFAKATWRVSAAVMLSRVLGLGREMMFAGLFGGSRWMDCFYLAFRVPNLLRDLFAEGALSQAFVTTFSKKVKSDGPENAWVLANRMMTLAAVFMSVVTLVGIFAAPWIVDLLTLLSRSEATKADYDPAEISLMVEMVRVMYPFIALVSLSALVMGMLNARDVFGMPALASCFFNIGSMAGGAAIGYWMDPSWGPRSLVGFSWGVVIGGVAQLVCQFPALRAVGYRFVADFRWNDSGVKQILKLMGPAVIAASVTQVNVAVNSMFAYGVGEGAVSWLTWAFRLMQLPIGVFGVAVATVTLPALSRAAINGVGEDFAPTLAKGLKMVMFLVFPATVGLVVLAGPIISLIYERGDFTVADRLATVGALQAYGYGLLFYAGLKVLQPAFYAIDKRWFPMMASIMALFVNAGCNYVFVFVFKWGHESLALTTSIVASLNFMFLYAAMTRYAGDVGTKSLVVAFFKIGVATAVMAVVCYFGNRMFFGDLAGMGFLMKALLVVGLVGVAAGAYFVAALALKVDEVGEMVAMLRKRLGR